MVILKNFSKYGPCDFLKSGLTLETRDHVRKRGQLAPHDPLTIREYICYSRKKTNKGAGIEEFFHALHTRNPSSTQHRAHRAAFSSAQRSLIQRLGFTRFQINGPDLFVQTLKNVTQNKIFSHLTI